MTPSARLKLRVITASVIGLALFQLVIGRYEYYPFIHWTMFSLPQHNPPPSKVGETVVVAMFANGDEHTVNLSKMFAAFPGSGGSAKSVEKYYLRQLREGNQAAAQKLAQLLEDKLGLVSIVGLRLESWQWDTHLSEFYSGQIRQTENSKIPDHIKEIITIPLIPE